VLATAVAGLPFLLFHPTGKLLLAVSAIVFIGISALMLTIVRPLSQKDLAMIAEVRPGIARYLKWFTRRALVERS
jgi:hypothetical protein